MSTRQFVGPVCNMAEDLADVTYTHAVHPKGQGCLQTPHVQAYVQEVSGSNIGQPVGYVVTCRNADSWPKIGTYKNV
jgi:hypothetical protein